MTYAPPPVQQVVSAPSASTAVQQPHEENKAASLGKKLAGNVANAATWGFGATSKFDIYIKNNGNDAKSCFFLLLD
jgi:hypothetical protein